MNYANAESGALIDSDYDWSLDDMSGADFAELSSGDVIDISNHFREFSLRRVNADDDYLEAVAGLDGPYDGSEYDA
jgi:hypothetical protein